MEEGKQQRRTPQSASPVSLGSVAALLSPYLELQRGLHLHPLSQEEAGIKSSPTHRSHGYL